MCIVYTITFSPSYIVSKVELVDKGYGINLQHYITSSFVVYKSTQLWPLLSFSYFVQMKRNNFILKDFSKIYTSIFFKNNKIKYFDWKCIWIFIISYIWTRMISSRFSFFFFFKKLVNKHILNPHGFFGVYIFMSPTYLPTYL
jgi:hypothetical protein